MMKHLLTIVLCLTTLTGLAQEEKIKKSEWWNGNPSYAVPIREVNVTARRPMKEIGIQKTQLDTTILHENIALSMADILTFNTSIFVKQYGRATLSTVTLAYAGDVERYANQLPDAGHDGLLDDPLLLHRRRLAAARHLFGQ